jgi:hypothetical protein
VLAAGRGVPVPELEEELPSGKFVVRLPRSLHQKMNKFAKKDDVSLNQAMVQAVTSKDFLTDPAFLPRVTVLLADASPDVRGTAAIVLKQIANKREIRNAVSARLAAEEDARSLLSVLQIVEASGDAWYFPHVYRLAVRILSAKPAWTARESVLGTKSTGVYGMLFKLAPASAQNGIDGRNGWPDDVTDKWARDARRDPLSVKALREWYDANRETAKWPALGEDGLPVASE